MPAIVPDDDRGLRAILTEMERRLLDRLDRLEASFARRLDALEARLSQASTHDRMRACEHPGMTGGDAR